MDSLELRLATAQDSEGILACLATAFEPYRNAYTPAAFADTILDSDSLKKRMEHMDVFVAIVDGKVAGTIAWQWFGGNPENPATQPGPLAEFAAPEGREGHIRGMAVLPEFCGKPSPGSSDSPTSPVDGRGESIAEQLLKVAEEGIIKDKCKWITLDTTEPLKRAQRFYEKHGYKASGQTRDFFGMRLIELEKRL